MVEPLLVLEPLLKPLPLLEPLLKPLPLPLPLLEPLLVFEPLPVGNVWGETDGTKTGADVGDLVSLIVGKPPIGGRVFEYVGAFVGLRVGREVGTVLGLDDGHCLYSLPPFQNPHDTGQLSPTIEAVSQTSSAKQYLLFRFSAAILFFVSQEHDVS